MYDRELCITQNQPYWIAQSSVVHCSISINSCNTIVYVCTYVRTPASFLWCLTIACPYQHGWGCSLPQRHTEVLQSGDVFTACMSWDAAVWEMEARGRGWWSEWLRLVNDFRINVRRRRWYWFWKRDASIVERDGKKKSSVIQQFWLISATFIWSQLFRTGPILSVIHTYIHTL